MHAGDGERALQLHIQYQLMGEPQSERVSIFLGSDAPHIKQVRL